MIRKRINSVNPYVHPSKAAAAYAVVLVLWIAASNYMNYASGEENLEAFIIDLLSGTLFTLITSALLFLFLRKNNSFIYNKNKEVQKSELKYRTLAENLDMFIARYDLDKKYVYLNRQAKKMFMERSLYEEEVIGRTPSQVYKHTEDGLRIEKNLDLVIQSGIPYTNVFSFKKVYYKWRLLPEFDEEGNIETVLSVLFDVTDIQNVRNEIDAKSAYLTAVIETSPMAIIDLNRDGTVASLWNHTAEKMFGWKAEEVIGTVLPLIEKDDVEDFIKRIEPCFGSEQIQFSGLKRLKKGGEYLYVDVTTCPLRDIYDKPDRALVFIEDITFKKECEAEILKLSEAVKQSPDAVLITDLEYKIQYVNPHFTRLTGYTPEEAIGNTPFKLLRGELNGEQRKNIRETLTSDKVWKGEFINRKKSGEKYWASVQVGPVKDPSGRTLYFVANERDITFKKNRDKLIEESMRERERNLREKEKMNTEIRKLSEALKQNPESVVITGLDGRIEYVNPAFELLSGYSFAEAAGRHPMELLQGDVNTESLQSIEDAITSGKIWNGEFLNTRKNGEKYWSEVQIGSIKDETGVSICNVAIERNITEKKLKDIQLRQSLKEKEVMLREIHHRVKNNLQVVSSLLKMQSEIHPNPETVEALKASRSRIISNGACPREPTPHY